jgi:tRNA U55 pseudouridine synthase TruB
MDFGLGDIPVCNLNETDAKSFCNGNFITVPGLSTSGELHRVFNDNKFLGIGMWQDSILKPKRVIN